MPIYIDTKNITNSKSGTPSITFNSKLNGISYCSIYGNGVQNGTPDQDNPVPFDGCGDKTPNLVNVSTSNLLTYDSGYNNFTINNTNATITTSGNALLGFIVEVNSDTQYTVKADSTKYGLTRIREYSSKPTTWSGSNFIQQSVNAQTGYSYSFTTTSSTKFICVTFYFDSNSSGAIISNIMLNTGSSILPYERYGYKIDISCNITTPLYLSEQQTVRQIKKLVLTGEEPLWYPRAGTPENIFFKEFPDIVSVANMAKCTHYQNQEAGLFNDLQDYHFIVRPSSAGGTNIGFRDSRFTNMDINTFKSYLASQYAAGTPVTVWYVSTEPETRIINEPLMKIGNYIDKLTFTDSQIQIPTVEGTNTLSVDTTIPPSNIEINYTLPDYSKITKIYKQDGLEIKHILDNNNNFIFKSKSYYDWYGIREIVRAGKAPQYYPIGSIIYDNFNESTGTAFQVVAYDNHLDPTLTEQGYTHSMTLCELMLTDVITFDAIEAFLYVETEIPAGVYRFTIPDYDVAYGGNKTYYFTSTKSIPVGGQLVLTWQYKQLPSRVASYSDSTSTTAIESNMTLTEWIEGTSPEAINLGTIAGPSTQLGSSDYGKMNHIHRARYGSNNYLQSGVRQYINSNSAANTWWTPQTIFDRSYGSRTSAGRLTKFNQDLVSVMATPTIQSRTNQIFETTSLDGTTFTLNTNYNITTDKMFLLSPYEINLNTDTTVGTIMNYYIDANNAKRVKLRESNNQAYYWWLRTPTPSIAYYVRSVSTSGALDSHTAISSYGCAPACVIQ